MRCAIINPNTKKVVNAVEYPTIPSPVPGYPPDYFAIAHDFAISGWDWNGSTVTDPNPPPPPPPPPTIDQIYDQTLLNERVLKAVVLALNDGSLPVGANLTGPQLKTIIKAHM